MGTYFHGNSNSSDIQQPSAEGLQTLYLMNPNYVPYSQETQNPTQNMLFANPNATNTSPHALNLVKFPHAPSSFNQHHLLGVTIPPSNFLGSNTADTPSQQYQVTGFHPFASSATANPPPHYNLWGVGSGSLVPDQSVMAIATTTTTTTNRSESAVTVAVTAPDAAEFPAPHIGFQRPVYQRGLSLSLSSQQTPYRSVSREIEVSPGSHGGGENSGVSTMHGVIFGSKYLKVAQELLDEVVNVDKGIMKGESGEGDNSNNENKEKRKVNIEASSSGGRENDGGKQVLVAELSTAQRQELQMKKSKLVSMLDEVRLYMHVIINFPQILGFKLYFILISRFNYASLEIIIKYLCDVVKVPYLFFNIGVFKKYLNCDLIR
jgi:hypothetical protein